MSTRITIKEARALEAAGVSFTRFRVLEITVAVTHEGQFRDREGEGLTWADLDSDQTEQHVARACEIIPGLGGFECGWGGWVLRKGYRAPRGDWNDRSSEYHY